VESDPSLLARRAHLLGDQGEIDEAARQFETAAQALIEAGNTRAAGDVLRVMGGVFEQRGLYARAREALTRATALLSDADGALAVALWSQIAILRLHDGDADGAESLAREVVARVDAGADVQLLATAYHNLAHILSLRGRFGESIATYGQAIELKRRQGLEVSQALSLNGLGVVFSYQRQFEQAEAALTEAEKLARVHGALVVASYALSNFGDVLRERGEIERALAAYRQSLKEKEALGSRYALAYTWNSLAELYRRTGELDQARGFSGRALALRSDEAGPIEYQQYRAEAGRIALAAGDDRSAREQLEPALSELRRLGCAHFALRAGWWLAAARFRSEAAVDPVLVELLTSAEASSDPPLLEDLVGEAVDLAVALWVCGMRTPALTHGLLAHAEEVQAVIQLMLAKPNVDKTDAEALLALLAMLPGYAPLVALAEAEHAPQAPVRSAAAGVLAAVRTQAPPPLDVVGFGGLRIQRRGEAIPERAWRRQRSLELLGLLLLAGPGGKTRDALIVECWPDAAPEAGVAQFHAHLHALRTGLEPEAARGSSRYVLAEGRLYRLAFDAIQHWDVGSFERAIEQARAAETRGNTADAERALADASEPYRGPLFEGLSPDGEWLELARERLHREAIAARVRLARLRESLGDPRGAEQAWTGVLELDPLREDAHRALIGLLHAQGQRDAALDAYRRCAEVLQRELGVEPGSQTVALYQRVLRS
jgi:DNA-binding SARP family transcriptional activator